MKTIADVFRVIRRSPGLSAELKASGNVLYVVDGRICWAELADRQQTLPELLVESVQRNLGEAVRRILRECVRTRTPIRSALVESGLLSREQYRIAIRQHIAAALVRMSNTGPFVVEASSVRRAPAWEHFTPEEMLSAVGCHVANAVPGDSERTLLREATGATGFGLLFADSCLGAVPVDIVGSPPLETAFRLAKWALRGLACDRESVLASRTRSGKALFAWEHAPFHAVVGQTGDRCFERGWTQVLRLRAQFPPSGGLAP